MVVNTSQHGIMRGDVNFHTNMKIVKVFRSKVVSFNYLKLKGKRKSISYAILEKEKGFNKR